MLCRIQIISNPCITKFLLLLFDVFRVAGCHSLEPRSGVNWPCGSVSKRSSMAGFYSGLLDGSLLESDMLEQLTREHSIGPDKTLLTQTRFGLDCMLDQPQLPNATFGLGPRAFGHPGAGGSVGFADPEHDVAFGFVTNTLGPYVLMDPRAQKLVGILAGCL